jgi:hypothetical protein
MTETEPADDICWHRVRVMGARELSRRRHLAGWPDFSVPRGWWVVCKDCLAAQGDEILTLWRKPA